MTGNEFHQPEQLAMLNEVYDTIEAILESLDAGGEQSLALAEETTVTLGALPVAKWSDGAFEDAKRNPHLKTDWSCIRTE
jgi:hypothetical protein